MAHADENLQLYLLKKTLLIGWPPHFVSEYYYSNTTPIFGTPHFRMIMGRSHQPGGPG